MPPVLAYGYCILLSSGVILTFGSVCTMEHWCGVAGKHTGGIRAVHSVSASSWRIATKRIPRWDCGFLVRHSRRESARLSCAMVKVELSEGESRATAGIVIDK